jgi:hypothetical protein
MNEKMKTKVTIFIKLTDGEIKEIIRASNEEMPDFFAEIMEECREVISLSPEETHTFLDDISGSAIIIKREEISYIEISRIGERLSIKDPEWGII